MPIPPIVTEYWLQYTSTVLALGITILTFNRSPASRAASSSPSSLISPSLGHFTRMVFSKHAFSAMRDPTVPSSTCRDVLSLRHGKPEGQSGSVDRVITYWPGFLYAVRWNGAKSLLQPG